MSTMLSLPEKTPSPLCTANFTPSSWFAMSIPGSSASPRPRPFMPSRENARLMERHTWKRYCSRLKNSSGNFSGNMPSTMSLMKSYCPVMVSSSACVSSRIRHPLSSLSLSACGQNSGMSRLSGSMRTYGNRAEASPAALSYIKRRAIRASPSSTALCGWKPMRSCSIALRSMPASPVPSIAVSSVIIIEGGTSTTTSWFPEMGLLATSPIPRAPHGPISTLSLPKIPRSRRNSFAMATLEPSTSSLQARTCKARPSDPLFLPLHGGRNPVAHRVPVTRGCVLSPPS
mmetsp:Transcript_10002/g.24718  ORF Transcript_10002/g.24718 Transcript_10002/m.24718 type:complete len:287 (-) Transcript_10002:185-1045(-)